MAVTTLFALAYKMSATNGGDIANSQCRRTNTRSTVALQFRTLPPDATHMFSRSTSASSTTLPAQYLWSSGHLCRRSANLYRI